MGISPAQTYASLHARMREATLLRSAADALGWDQETNLPDDGVAWRGEQLAYLNGQRHRLTTSPEVGEWLATCEAAGAGSFPESSIEETNLRGWRRTYDRATKLPVALVEELTRTTSLAQSVWAKARQVSDFAMFQPHLEKLVVLTREKADAWGWQTCRYDALLDEYEPGARSADIATLFAELAPQISALVGPATEQARGFPRLLSGSYPMAAQTAFNREVAEAIGFDFSAGRIDTTTHPFCTGLGPCDTRLTTRYDENDFTTSLYGVLHEAGHGLYDQGLNKAEWGQPAGDAVSLGIHESQSRLWENHIGGSRRILGTLAPARCHHFPHLGALDAEQVAGAERTGRAELHPRRGRRGHLRPAHHPALRTRTRPDRGRPGRRGRAGRMERKVRASCSACACRTTRRGCLQDVHWSFGFFGYFATYTLGNLNAAQLMRAARR